MEPNLTHYNGQLQAPYNFLRKVNKVNCELFSRGLVYLGYMACRPSSNTTFSFAATELSKGTTKAADIG
jgi:hypothetical protein